MEEKASENLKEINFLNFSNPNVMCFVSMKQITSARG